MLEELRRIRNQQPFIPYTITLTDGRVLPVNDRFDVGFAKSYIVVNDVPNRWYLEIANSLISEVSLNERKLA